MTNRKEQLLNLIFAKISKFRTQDLNELKKLIINFEKTGKFYCCCDPTCESCEICKPNKINDKEIEKHKNWVYETTEREHNYSDFEDLKI